MASKYGYVVNVQSDNTRMLDYVFGRIGFGKDIHIKDTMKVLI
jgi:hypothetical protein